MTTAPPAAVHFELGQGSFRLRSLTPVLTQNGFPPAAFPLHLNLPAVSCFQ